MPGPGGGRLTVAAPGLTRLAELPPLGPGPHPAPGTRAVHIWRDAHPGTGGAEPRSPLSDLLAPEERARALEFGDDLRRQQFIRGRVLCRRVLSLYAAVRPEDWRFALGSRGKPVIATPRPPSPLWFNLSHSEGATVCAVTGAGPEIGIDIEPVARGRETLAIAEQFFPPAEVDALRRVPGPDRGETFIRLWALKESFAKAREVSLATELGHTSFDVARPDDITVAVRRMADEQAREWRFRLFALEPAQIVALAVRTGRADPLTVCAGTLA